MRSLVTFLVLVTAVLAFNVSRSEKAHGAILPRVSDVAPDLQPFDLSGIASTSALAPVKARHTGVTPSERVYRCDAPRVLENDATQTVRVCAWGSK